MKMLLALIFIVELYTLKSYGSVINLPSSIPYPSLTVRDLSAEAIENLKKLAITELDKISGSSFKIKLDEKLKDLSVDERNLIYQELISVYSKIDLKNPDEVEKWNMMARYTVSTLVSTNNKIIIKNKSSTSNIKNEIKVATGNTTVLDPFARRQINPAKGDSRSQQKYLSDQKNSLGAMKEQIKEKLNSLNFDKANGINAIDTNLALQKEAEIKSLEEAAKNLDNNMASLDKMQTAYSASLPEQLAAGMCLLDVNNYSAWGFSRIAMVGMSGSTGDNQKMREIKNGDVAYIETDVMDFQNKCENNSPWLDWASDSKIHSLYQKARGKRSLAIVCRNGQLKTTSIRNRPEGSPIDSLLYGCNGKCESETQACPDVLNNCRLKANGKLYLDGEEIISDFSNFDNYDGRNLPYVLGQYGDPKNVETIEKYAKRGTCQIDGKGFFTYKVGRFICDAKDKSWRYLNDIDKSQPFDFVQVPGGYSAESFKKMVSELKTCEGSATSVTKSISGTYTNQSFKDLEYIINENTWSGLVTFYTGGSFQNMAGTLRKIADNAYQGVANHTPSGCNTNVPFDITLTFNESFSEAQYKTIMLDNGCGLTKGQTFTGTFVKK